jgi:hypothetical protein
MRTKLARLKTAVIQTGDTEHDLDMLHVMHRDHCGARLGLTAATIEQMVHTFVTARGGVTMCPPAYAATSRQYNLQHSSH